MFKLFRLLFVMSLLFLAASYLIKDRYPNVSSIDKRLLQEPIQSERVRIHTITHEENNITYTIKPLHEYELYGLIVSQHVSQSFPNVYHRLWKDFINTKDICVVWGKNVEMNVYQKLHFKNGSYTCQVSTGYNEAWQNFNVNQFSNNHLLVVDPKIQDIIDRVRPGDQIRIKGYLAEYSHDEGFTRGTSTTRTDDGDGACETILVTEAEILKPSYEIVDRTYELLLYAVPGLFILGFMAPIFMPMRYER